MVLKGGDGNKFEITRWPWIPNNTGLSQNTTKIIKFVQQIIERLVPLNWNTIKFFKQTDWNSCGYAMLANMLSYYDFLWHQENPDTIYREINFQRWHNQKEKKWRQKNLTSVDLNNYLQNKNFSITPIENINQLKEHLSRKNFSFLYMMFDENSWDHYTWVIFINWRYYLFDSLKDQPEPITEENLISRVQKNLDLKKAVWIAYKSKKMRVIKKESF